SAALTALSCTSTTVCVVGSADGAVSSWNGTAWSAFDVVTGDHALVSLSCVASGFCMAADSAGGVVWSSGVT
ncbi:MAG: hypothetical protein ACYCV5_08875, partial [Acidimicrobiales bacterium]